MSYVEYRRLIRHACYRCGCPELERGIRIKKVKNIKHLAEAEYLGNGKGIIYINLDWLEYMTDLEKSELILHEVSHLIHDYKFASYNDRAHGKEWRAIMRTIGIIAPEAKI